MAEPTHVSSLTSFARLNACRDRTLEKIDRFLMDRGRVAHHNAFVDKISHDLPPQAVTGFNYNRLKLPENALALLHAHPITMGFDPTCQFVKQSGYAFQFNPAVFRFLPDGIADKLVMHETQHLLIDKQGRGYTRTDQNTNYAIEMTCDAFADAVYPEVPIANVLKHIEICLSFMKSGLDGRVEDYIGKTATHFTNDHQELFQQTIMHPATLTRCRQSEELLTDLLGDFVGTALRTCNPFLPRNEDPLQTYRFA